MNSFENRLHELHKGIVSGDVYSSIPGKNEETLAMISLYRHGASWAKLEAKKWLQNVMDGVE